MTKKRKKNVVTAYATYNKRTKKIATDVCDSDPLLIYKCKYDCDNFRLSFCDDYEIRKVRITIEEI